MIFLGPNDIPRHLQRCYDVLKVVKNYLLTVLCQLLIPLGGKKSNKHATEGWRHFMGLKPLPL